MSKGAVVGAFIFGAISGAAAAWYLTKTKYEQISNDEIEAVRQRFEQKFSEKKEHEKEEQAEEPTHQPSIKEYADIVKSQKYVNYSDAGKEDISLQMKKQPSKITVIHPNEFGENELYDKVVLYLYSDGVLADSDSDEILEDPERFVGDDYDSHFGDFEADSVFIKNETEETYYEICRDERTYEEVCGSKPDPVEVQ